MTIHEMERKSGLERTNIRFYEREGLLNPQRRENGYRDYSEDDLQLLLKIKLLRRLGFSLEAIRSLKDGDTALDEALARRLAAIDGQRRELDATERVCAEMRQDGVSFPTLDAQRYLNAYDQSLRLPSGIRPTVPESDRVAPVRCPWRRYFARAMDISLVTLVICLILALVFRVNINNMNSLLEWLLGLLSWLVLVPLEALCLSRWGTTPGKWLLGIRLEHIDGQLLTFGEAAWRAGRVFAKGEGFTIPFYNLYRLWKSYKAVSDGEDVEWDEDVTILVSELRWHHPVRYIAAEAAHFIVLTVFVFLIPMMPVNRGELTVAEFVENFNYLAKYHDLDRQYLLQEDGTFVRDTRYDYGSEVHIQRFEEAALQFEEENGVLTSVAYRNDLSSAVWGYSDPLCPNFFKLTVMSWLWADSDIFSALAKASKMDDIASVRQGESKTEDLLGYRLTYSVEDHGDTLDPGSDWTNRNLTYSFRIAPIP